MSYEAWRISYRSSEQAARAAWVEWHKAVSLAPKPAECEPVGYFFKNDRGFWHQAGDPVGFKGLTKLYTTPQPCPEIYSKDVMNRIQTICEQSLTPEIYDKWLEVSEALYKTRRDLQ